MHRQGPWLNHAVKDLSRIYSSESTGSMPLDDDRTVFIELLMHIAYCHSVDREARPTPPHPTACMFSVLPRDLTVLHLQPVFITDSLPRLCKQMHRPMCSTSYTFIYTMAVKIKITYCVRYHCTNTRQLWTLRRALRSVSHSRTFFYQCPIP